MHTFNTFLFLGYGNVSPRTAAGRAATVAYAAAGVPLTLACLAGLGASLARLARTAWLSASKKKAPKTWRKEGEVREKSVMKFIKSCQIFFY